MKTNIIFLDIDGVLNSETFGHNEFIRTGKPSSTMYFVDPEAVARLEKLLNERDDLKLVISSSWRGFSFNDTVKLLNKTKISTLTKFVVGVTPRNSKPRGEQIKQFIELANKWDKDNINITQLIPEKIEIKNYIILDDDSDFLPEQMNNFVKTSWKFGLLDEHIEKIKQIL